MIPVTVLDEITDVSGVAPRIEAMLPAGVRPRQLLTYRQAEYTFGPVADTLAGDDPGGLPSPAPQAACDDLLEASVPQEFKNASRSLAVDWTDLESFSRPPPRGTSDCADPPRRPGGIARTTCCAARTSCSSATTSPQGS